MQRIRRVLCWSMRCGILVIYLLWACIAYVLLYTYFKIINISQYNLNFKLLKKYICFAKWTEIFLNFWSGLNRESEFKNFGKESYYNNRSENKCEWNFKKLIFYGVCYREIYKKFRKRQIFWLIIIYHW